MGSAINPDCQGIERKYTTASGAEPYIEIDHSTKPLRTSYPPEISSSSNNSRRLFHENNFM